MSRKPKPWFRRSRGVWYVCINGKQRNLGADREVAFQRFYRLMAEQPKNCVSSDSVLALLDAFLEWTSRHRAKETYLWYKKHAESFAKSIPQNLAIDQLRPFHVQRWVDAHPDWSNGMRRGAIIAVQRPFSWARKMGYIERSPIAYIEKPAAGKRDGTISQAEYERILAHITDDHFRDLLVVSWETGCRPQESLRVAARHVDAVNHRWVFPPHEAKVQSYPRIVYLTDRAMAITQKLMLKNPEGSLFRNRDGKAWTPSAASCRFGRLKKHVGKKYCLYLFRHSFATRLLQSGVDALTVSILLGHSDVSMLAKTYQHLTQNPQYLKDALRKVAG